MSPVFTPCTLPIDAAFFPWTTLTVSIELSGTEARSWDFSPDEPGVVDDSRTTSCAYSKTLTRIPYAGNTDPFTEAPQGVLADGQFWIFQDCCCPGRWTIQAFLTTVSVPPSGSLATPFFPLPQVAVTENVNHTLPLSGSPPSPPPPTSTTVTVDGFLNVAFNQGYDPTDDSTIPLFNVITPRTQCRTDGDSTVQPPIGDCIPNGHLITDWQYVYPPISPSVCTAGSDDGTYSFTGSMKGILQLNPSAQHPLWPNQFSNVTQIVDTLPDGQFFLIIEPIDPLSTTHAYTGDFVLSGTDARGGSADFTLTVTIALS